MARRAPFVLALLFLLSGAWGAVTSEVARSDYVGTGSLATYAWTFPVKAATELRVITQDANGQDVELTAGVDYSTSAVAANGTGSITLTAGNLTNGYKLSIQRGIPYTQTVTPGAAYNAATIANALDRLEHQIVRLKGDVDRAIKIPYLEAGGDSVTKLDDNATNRANQTLVFDSSGNASVGAVTNATASVFGQSLIDDTSASDARTTLGIANIGALDSIATRTVIGRTAGGTGAPSAISPDDVAVISDSSTTSRDLSARFAERFNVRDFGALGDGSTNDRAAIQAAIDLALSTKVPVYIPKGTYVINSGLSITSGITIYGDGFGSIIKHGAVSRFLPILAENLVAPITGLVLRDFAVDGNGKGQLDAGLIQINNCVGFVCNGLRIYNAGTPAEASPQGVNGISVSAGSIGNTGSQGVIQNCLIEACTKAAINWTTESINGLIIGNIARSNTGNGTTPGIQINGGYNGKVIGNSAYSNEGPGIYLATSGGVGTYRNARNCIIMGNHCYSNGTGAGATLGAGIYVSNAAASTQTYGRIIVSGNVCYDNGVSVSDAGILIQNEDNILVSGNYVRNNPSAGITINGCTNVFVYGNLCDGNNTSNAANVSGIYIKTVSTNPTADIQIINNKCMNPSGGHQKYPVYYDDSSAAGAARITIRDNEAHNHETSNGINFDQAMPSGLRLRHSFRKQTTDATALQAFYMLMPDNSAVSGRMRTTAVKSDGSNRALYDKSALFYRNGGAATIQGAMATAVEIESDATWNQALNATGNYIRAQLTGVAATTINWDSELEIVTP